ncbi:MAG: dehypoxanthine futalosine cyclase [Bacteroidetes bacterium GWF2_49_14]|nr:MAG: dehypoxanthine futalosine cyclase [Bacteroidetes bacterium GWF2_49_14]HBB90934.1 dehypoxanthine futalosine cyclase [Bacteroidales bacterium]
MTTQQNILDKAVGGTFLSHEEANFLYLQAGDGELMEAADRIRNRLHPGNTVTWIIDRNVNITNVCVSFCKFCNFCRRGQDEDAYITTIEQYREKIDRLFELGGRQLLLQGGMHPTLGLDFYTGLFRNLKEEYPALMLHALGPPEIVHLSRLEKTDFETVLRSLRDAGLDSLPGAGAEILVDRVRRIVSKGKCSAEEWLEVMRVAHRTGLPTSATMMFGHAETREERIEHILRIRDLQAEKPTGSYGFLNFVPWPFMDEGTALRDEMGIRNNVDTRQYIRLLSMARILLPNVSHIQASWLTTGITAGQICLHAGADDFGSVMIEENVVSQAGARNSMDSTGMQAAIVEAGFVPRKRNQLFELID